MSFNINSYSSKSEQSQRQAFLEMFQNTPIPENEILQNLGIYTNRQNLSRFLFLDHIYKQILPIHGVIMEFGVRWGQNLCQLSSLRGMYEPCNFSRKIIGFDTFKGFPKIHPKDGSAEAVAMHAFGVSENYEEYLTKVLDYHETESPLPHIKKYELVTGDATETIHKYLEDHPETIISMAFFDFDLYEPTKVCLEAIKPYLTKGSILAFDELNCKDFPGETIAFQEVLGKNNYSIRRLPINPLRSYVIFE